MSNRVSSRLHARKDRLQGANTTMSGRPSRARIAAAALAGLTTMALCGSTASADIFFWDQNGETANTGGTGAWDTTNSFWRQGTDTGTLGVWVDGASNEAHFKGTAGTITLSGPRTASTVNFETNTGNNVVTGSTLTLGATQSVVMPIHTTTTQAGQVINSAIAGTDLVIWNPNTASATGRSLLNLGGTNTFTGNLILDGGAGVTNGNASNTVSISNANALPATASVLMKRNFSQLLFTAGTAAGGSNTPYTATFANNINLNASGSSSTFTSVIGASAAGTVVTLTGTLSGNADLQNQIGVSGGQGVIVLNPTTANTYTGATRILSTSNGVLRIGKDNALPTGTALSFAGTTANDGSFDLNGKNQTVASLSSTTSAGTSPALGYIGGIVNNTATLSTLTINGAALTKYDGNIGTPPPNQTTPAINFNSNLLTASTNIALNLAPTNTGTLILTNANNAPISTGSDYSGGTTISGGRLVAANTVGSVTGTGPVTVGTGGTLASAGGALGVISGHVTSAGLITPGAQMPTGLAGTALPGSATTTNVGTMTLNGGLTLQSGANVNFKVSSAGNDKIALGGATDPDILTLPGTAQSVNFNIVDLASNITAPTTYTLLSYPVSTTLPGLDTSTSGPIKIVKPVSGLGILATYTLTNNTGAHTVDLSVSGLFGRKIGWRGDSGTGSGTWDIATTSNFDNAGSPSTYLDPDEVTFDEGSTLGSGDVVVDVAAGGVTPANIFINNATRKYTIQGGAIKSGGVTKNGAGALVLSGANSYAGGTIVNGTAATTAAPYATLEIAGDSSLGAVPATPQVNLTLNKVGANSGVVLKFNGATTLHANRNVLITQTNGGGATFDTNGNDVTIAGQILAGTAAGVNIIKQGNGVLTLTGDNSTSAGGGAVVGTIVNGGSIKASADVNIARVGAGLTLNAGGLIYGASFDMPGRQITVASGGGTIDTAGFNSTLNGVVASTGTLTKQGLGTLTLIGTNTQTGPVIIAGGTLKSAKSASLATQSAVTANTGATLAVQVGGAGEYSEAEVNTLLTKTTLQSGSSLGFDTANGAFTYGTSLAAGDYGVTKLGANTLTLTAANNHTGGTTVSAGTLVLGNADATAGGAIDVKDGAVARAQAALPKAVTVSTLNTNASGKLDVTNNSMVIKGMTPSAVRLQLQSGYNSGAWNGATGIVTTSVTSETSVGYATNAQLGNLTEFKGVTGLTGTDVLVKYTYAGDANLDGKVDIGDLGLLAGAWQQLTGKVWFDGDFTYDGAVDIGDLGLLAGNWQKGTAGNPNPPLMTLNEALAQFSAFDGVVVPEPAGLSVMALGAVGLLARRRRTAGSVA